MDKGWISIHRKILKNPLVKFSDRYSYFEAWVWLLLRATYSKQKVVLGSDIYYLKEGEIITSQLKLMKQFGWGNSKLGTFLKLYKKDGMIDVKTNNKLTMITILKFSELQNFQIVTNDQTRNKQEHSNKDINKDNKVSIETRLLKFTNYVNSLKVDTNKDTKDSFIDYWTEKNLSGKKMKFEMQKTFDIKRRLLKWIQNAKDWNIKPKQETLDLRFPFDKSGNARLGYCSNPKCKSPTNFLDKFNPSFDSTCCSGFKVVSKKEREALLG